MSVSAKLRCTGNFANNIGELFSVDAYTGTGAARATVNGVDLFGEGGLVWFKRRDAAVNHVLIDTERGMSEWLFSNQDGAETTASNGISSFNSDGFDFGSNTWINGNGNDYVSWTFRKAEGFFDIVTYTGNQTVRTISHNLGETPGMMIFKGRTQTYGWGVYHKDMDATAPEDYAMELHEDGGRVDNDTFWNDTQPTATDFTLGSDRRANRTGVIQIGYLFAHNPSQGIFCGGHIGTGVAGATVDLGWKPQFIMWKKADGTGHWFIVDTARGLGVGVSNLSLFANENLADLEMGDGNIFEPTDTGITINTGQSDHNGNGVRYIFMAIREE